MFIPRHWAEAQTEVPHKKRTVKLRRYGWSDQSPEDAQALAQQRLALAAQQLQSGQLDRKRETASAYNGADGMPIREEIVAVKGNCVITRNGYGARCLNTPDALFTDIDLPTRFGFPRRFPVTTIVFLLALTAGLSLRSWPLAFGIAIGAVMLTQYIRAKFFKSKPRGPKQAEQAALENLQEYAQSHPQWKMRIYRTPAGLRVLVTHRAFTPGDPEVAEFFQATQTDPLYAKMCVNQQCFRARLTAKPWRMDIRARPPLHWPAPPHTAAERTQWIGEYEEKAASYAACHFLQEMGSGNTHPSLDPAIRLHDELSQAKSEKPIA